MSTILMPNVPWQWHKLAGSPEALKWCRKELPKLDRVVKMTRGRTAVVQAGGNLGVFPKRLAQRFETVYTFEPSADLFALMLRNAPEPNIVKFQAALGDERCLVGLSRARRDASGKPEHEGLTHIDGPGVIPTLRIDDLGLHVCDLIYLDIEGWELYALRGAADTIETCRPVVCVEINKNIDFVHIERDAVREEILRHGYRFVGRLASDEIFVPAEWGD